MALVLEYQDLVVEERITNDGKVGICIELSVGALDVYMQAILTDEVTD